MVIPSQTVYIGKFALPREDSVAISIDEWNCNFVILGDLLVSVDHRSVIQGSARP
jgi:hypothetical protein